MSKGDEDLEQKELAENANSVAANARKINSKSPTKPVKKRARKKKMSKSSYRIATQETGKGGSRRRTPRSFPKRTLKDALQVARAIEEKNSGKPWDPEEVAAACGSSKKNTNFYYQTAAARDYGLTLGTRDSSEISLTSLGRSVVLPESPQERILGLQNAFHAVELFKKIDEHYGDKELHEDRFFDSLAQKQFGVTKDQTEEFRTVFKQNRKFLAEEGVRHTSATPKENTSRLGEHTLSTIHTQVSSHSRDAFVIMPFTEKGAQVRPPGFFREVLRQIIAPAGDTAEFNVHTAMQSGSDVIQSTIIEHLIRADLVIADLTDHNPNVLFELGVRIALDKPIVLIRAEGTAGIFDVDNLMRVESYDPLLWVDTVKTDVQKIARHISDGWSRRDTNPPLHGDSSGSKLEILSRQATCALLGAKRLSPSVIGQTKADSFGRCYARRDSGGDVPVGR